MAEEREELTWEEFELASRELAQTIADFSWSVEPPVKRVRQVLDA
jgi:hypothetical protein